MLTKFIQYIENKLKISVQNKILLTVSGGADSVVLLDLFSKAGFNCGIAHCNFHLRGNDADLDEKLVIELAEKYCFPIYTIDFETIKYAQSNGISIEMAARELRYNWFEKIRQEKDYQFIATGHHIDDLIETFFINLTRGTGIRGLSGLKAKHGHIIRPLLFTDRESIMNYIKDKKLLYREDKTNLDEHIIRNKFRHSILPEIGKINPSYKQSILKTIENLKDAEILMNKEIERTSKEICHFNEDIIRIDISKLIGYHNVKTYIFELLLPFGFNGEQVSGIVKTLNFAAGKVFYSKTHQLIKDREQIIIKKIENNKPFKDSVSEKDKIIKLPSGLQLELKILKRSDEFIIPTKSEIAALDYDKLKFPLEIRKWEQGDYFYPLGMAKRKKLSDYFIDIKLNILEKQNTYIITSDNKIVWLVGHRIDDRFKISDKTDNILIISPIII
jgi:tRNA(Ile)-lysidine synthase